MAQRQGACRQAERPTRHLGILNRPISERKIG